MVRANSWRSLGTTGSSLLVVLFITATLGAESGAAAQTKKGSETAPPKTEEKAPDTDTDIDLNEGDDGVSGVGTGNEDCLDGDCSEACLDKERCNPWLGGMTNFWGKLAIFLGILILAHFLFSFGLFAAGIRKDGEPLPLMASNVGFTVIAGVLASFFCFVEYTWPADWCTDAVDLCTAPLADQLGAVTWWVWGLVLVVGVVAFGILKMAVKPSTGSH